MIAVLDYGIGNLRSAQKALIHLGADARLVTSPSEVDGASGFVLPGVGAFGPSMEALCATGLASLVHDAVTREVPFLGICVGLQLLYDSSDESPGIAGLGLLPGNVKALPAGVKSPQMQWNRLRRLEDRPSTLLRGADREPWVYFVHSFAPELTEDTVAVCDYGSDIVAAVERGRVWGTQFHPEKSGSVGLAIMANFVACCAQTG
jgi:glutamine amidotransferase